MLECKNVRYLYDGSFEDFLCCVYESIYSHTIPSCIEIEHLAQPSLFEDILIQTHTDKAQRVFKSFSSKIHPSTELLIRDVFLSCMDEKEILMLRYLHFAYKQGAKAAFMLSHPLLSPLLKAQRHLKNEAHHFLGFVRFEQVGTNLVSRIAPKNFVLPYLSLHFCKRYANENLLIYDETHKMALVYEHYVSKIIALDNLTTPPLSEDELEYQMLWKKFYNTIEIKARHNEQCRRNHCPKRYWGNMLEMPNARETHTVHVKHTTLLP